MNRTTKYNKSLSILTSLRPIKLGKTIPQSTPVQSVQSDKALVNVTTDGWLKRHYQLEVTA